MIPETYTIVSLLEDKTLGYFSISNFDYNEAIEDVNVLPSICEGGEEKIHYLSEGIDQPQFRYMLLLRVHFLAFLRFFGA